MNKLAFFIGVALLAWVVLGADPDPGPEERADFAAAQTTQSPTRRGPTAGNGIAEFRTTRAPDGHFYADVRVNGATIRMLVDTGATTVLLSRADAQRAGIQVAAGDFTSIGQTVSGDIALKSVTIDRIALGPVVGYDVPAMVAEGDVPVSLLGQSFLERVGRVEIEGSQLVLR